MKQKLFYCAFYSSTTAGLAGQQNLSRPLRATLAANFDIEDLSPEPGEIQRFPRLTNILAAFMRLWLHRISIGSTGPGVTVVDMIHSVTVLPRARFSDRLIVIGHDSYALRTWRDFAMARQIGARLRLGGSAVGWSLAEFFLRNLAWKTLFVSPIDLAFAARGGPSGLLAIPIDKRLLKAGREVRQSVQRRHGDVFRILVPLPVENLNQRQMDIELVGQLLQATYDGMEIILWGRGAKHVASRMSSRSYIRVIEWVDDYAGFLSEFDLLVYPRMVGSGFHTKLAEALVIGVPCLCVDWVAAPLIAAGYDKVTTYSGPQDFSSALAEAFALYSKSQAMSMPVLPANTTPDAALMALVEACSEAVASE